MRKEERQYWRKIYDSLYKVGMKHVCFKTFLSRVDKLPPERAIMKHPHVTVREIYDKLAEKFPEHVSIDVFRSRLHRGVKPEKAITRNKRHTGPTSVGLVFGNWTVVAHIGTNIYGQAKMLCRCKCGTERPVNLHDLVGGKSRSCGYKCKLKRLGEKNDEYVS